ncbi:MAG TPA: molybdopterin cofactor-binding domain-containing protein, partial [Hyphomicrobiaceae bacterium]|nr:molybdopterin cofactor-binding domain-containing protein [Hyphomicrobiaceae bacterium]
KAIRLAASAIRQRLEEEAATLVQAQRDDIEIVDGHVRVGDRETSLTLWSVAKTVDLNVPVLEHALPKPVAKRHLIGTPMPRLDLRDKLLTPAFIQDISLDGMLHGRALQPPSPRSRMVRFDAGSFRQRFPDVRLVQNGSFVGVIAALEETAVRAIQAAEQLAAWDDGADAPANLLEAIAATEVPEIVVAELGNAAGVLGTKVQVAARKPFTAHASIAPSCAIATWRDEHLEIFSHTQGPHGLRDAMGIVFGFDAKENVTVIHKPGAGTYGHSGQDDVALDAALLAREVPGTPVRVVWSRADDFAASPLGPGMTVSAQATLGQDGRIAALSLTSNSQPHAQRPGRGGIAGLTAAELIDPPFPWESADDVPIARGGGADRNGIPLYKVPNLKVAKRIIKDLPIRTSALRGLGAIINVFTLEALMDECAKAAGADPIAYRLDHLDDERAKAVIEHVAQMAGWPGEQHDGEALGLGFGQYKNKSAYCAVVAKVQLDETVRVSHVWAAADAGEVINPNGLENQIEGGIVQAVSMALKEEIAFEGDRVVTANWSGYPILKFSEVPEITVKLIDRPELPPLGAGETSLGPTAAAIGNAVARALGVRVASLPINRQAIVEAGT